jgi:hypothetical protein
MSRIASARRRCKRRVKTGTLNAPELLRRSQTEQNHFGLGLTLVSLYIEVLGGQIDHHLTDGKFISAVRLPEEGIELA